MLLYIIKRLFQMIPLLLIISFLGFGIIRVAEVYANADPLTQLKMSPSVTEDTLRREKARLGYETEYKESAKLSESTYQVTQVAANREIASDSVKVFIKGKKEPLTLIQPGEMQYFKGKDSLIFSQSDAGKKVSVSFDEGQAKVMMLPEKLKLPAQNNAIKIQGEDGKAFTDLKLAAGEFAVINSQFYFDQSVIGKELEMTYSVPNGFIVRYWAWISKFVVGDMGESYYFKSPVLTLILSRLNNTVVLGIASLLVTWLIAIPLGVFLAVRQYSLIDQVSSAISYFFMGFPDFFLAIILLLLAAVTGWFPIGEMVSVKVLESGDSFAYFIDLMHHLILPTVTLSLISIASLQRRMRANLLDVLGEEYIKTARAKGLSENKVIYKHAVRNAINPIITLLGFEVAGLISGAAFVEIIFSWPGLGNMMLQAVLGTDLNLVMAGLMISTIMLLLGNLLADILLAFADPRIKLEA